MVRSVFQSVIINLMYSIEELPDVVAQHTHLTPRSYEAIRRLGYRLEDLSKKTSQEIHDIYNDHETNKAILDKRTEHEEGKRKARLKEVLEVRREVLDEEKQGVWSST